MHGVSREYCLEMILSHEPTETGKKRRELGIDGQYISILYVIRILNKPAVSYVVDLVTGTVVKSRYDFHDFSWKQRGRVVRAPDLKPRGRGLKPRSDQLA